MLPSADRLNDDDKFIFLQDLAPAYTAKCTSIWFIDYGINVLDWPANWPDLNSTDNLRSFIKRKI